jgi:HAD superfamily hydrolase (TIGR01509 family)
MRLNGDRWRGRRCPWAEADPLLATYHDEERGRFPASERALFEALSLEILQGGCAWRDVLARRDELRQAFAGFDPERLAEGEAPRLERACHQVGLDRHRGRVRAVVQNARALLSARAEWGRGPDDREAFARWLWATPLEQVTSDLERRFHAVSASGARNFAEAVGLAPLGHAPNCWRARAVILDLDGVVVDSEIWWREVREEMLAEAGRTWTEADQAAVMGRNTRQWAEVMVQRHGLGGDPEAVASEVVRRMMRRYRERGAPTIEGAVPAVRALAERHPLAIASSAPRELIAVALEAAGLLGTFEVVVSSDEVAAGKPAPDVYRLAARRLALRPSDCVVVEDTLNGVLAAREAGMPAVLVPNLAVPPAPGAREAATVVLDRLAALDPDALLEAWSTSHLHKAGSAAEADEARRRLAPESAAAAPDC